MRHVTGCAFHVSGYHWPAFNIADNTLGPTAERFICPWARSDQPGYANGGNKFDLNQWDPAYFARLKDFVAKAGDRGIVVVPDILANAGGVVVSYFEWSQNLSNDFWPEEKVLKRLHSAMTTAFNDVHGRCRGGR